MGFWLLGLLVAWFVRSWQIAMIFLIVPGLLWFYSSSYKRQFLLGNLIIAFASALPPFLVAQTNVAWLYRHYPDVMPYLTISRDLFLWTGGFALFAFLTTWIREIIKDLQDQNGDRELECHTLPIVWGELPRIIVVDGMDIDWEYETEALSALANSGACLIIARMPSPDEVKGNTLFRKIAGIKDIYSADIGIDGVRLFPGFFIGQEEAP